MGRVIHFEIHASKPERAIGFYEKAFGWKFQKWEGPFQYWLVMTGDEKEPGIDGGLMQREGDAPSGKAPVNGFACSVSVDDIDASMNTVKEAGGTVVTEKQSIPGVGYQFYCKDTESNLVGVHQEDRSAT